MTLLLPPSVVETLEAALKVGGLREIGGVLMGEHVAVNTFRVIDISVQIEGGTFARFVRRVSEIVAPLRRFFRRTNRDYGRFNYLGEWHSHHSFSLTPSQTDHRTMLELVHDPAVGALFAVLMLVKLDDNGRLESAVTVYERTQHPVPGVVEIEN